MADIVRIFYKKMKEKKCRYGFQTENSGARLQTMLANGTGKT